MQGFEEKMSAILELEHIVVFIGNFRATEHQVKDDFWEREAATINKLDNIWVV